jgi:sec-independent protein translocase protein TatA
MKTLLFLGSIGMPELLIIAFIILLLFGAKRIPDLMKGIGKGVRSFKEGVNDIEKQVDSIDTDVNKDEKKK